MNLKQTVLGIALATAGLGLMQPALAAGSKELDELRAEIRKLREEVNALRAQTAQAQSSAGAAQAQAREAQAAAAQAQTQAREAQAAAAPNVAMNDRVEALEVKSKDSVVQGDIPGSFRLPGSETSLRIYGFAELNWVHEMRGDNSDSDYSTFLPYAPLNDSAQGRRHGRDYLHARTSRLGVEASTPTSYGPLGIKVEGDFNNEPRTGNSAAYGTTGNIYTQQATNSYNFRLRHAYGQFGGLLIGQTWSTFMDVDNSPENVDFNGPIGSTFLRQPQIRYTYPTPNLGSFTVALENSVSYVLDSTATATPAGFSRVPDLVGRWDKSFGWGSASARIVSHEHRVKDMAGGSASKRGLGVAATAFVKVRGSDFLSAGVTAGKGIGRYFNYIEGAFYDEASNQILLERALGAVLGYQYKASDTFRVNAVLGVQKNFDNDYTRFAVANGLDSGRFGVNRKVWQSHLGFIWNPLKPVDIGVEWVLGRRETLAGERGDMNRLNISAKYNFN